LILILDIVMNIGLPKEKDMFPPTMIWSWWTSSKDYNKEIWL